MPPKKAAKKKQQQAAAKQQPAASAPAPSSAQPPPVGDVRPTGYVFGPVVRQLVGALQQLRSQQYADCQIVVVRRSRTTS